MDDNRFLLFRAGLRLRQQSGVAYVDDGNTFVLNLLLWRTLQSKLKYFFSIFLFFSFTDAARAS
jgi:hypothetical protein